jgi:PAS domain S-box-containing protein
MHSDDYRMLFNSIEEGVFIIEKVDSEQNGDADFRFILTNPAFEKITGLTNVIEKTMMDVIPDINAVTMKAFNSVIRTGRPARLAVYEKAFQCWFGVSAFPMKCSEHKRIAVTFNNITERKQAEEALLKSKKRQEFLLRLSELRTLTDSLKIHDVATRAALEYFQADRCYYCEIADNSAIIRQDASIGDLPSVAGTYPMSMLPIHKSLIDAGQPDAVNDVHTTDMVDEDLRKLCIQSDIISYLDVPVIKNGTPVGILCITQCSPREWTESEMELAAEVTERIWAAVERAANQEERQKLEEDLRYQKNLFESVIENMNDAIVIYDKDCKIGFINAEARKIYPYLDTNSTVDAVHSDFGYYDFENNPIPKSNLPSKRVLRGERIMNERILIKRPDKNQYTEINAMPIFHKDGSFAEAVVTHRDITDSVLNQRVLKEQQELMLKAEKGKRETLEEAIKMKDEFLYLITHEFKTPITVISSVLQSVESSMKNDVPEKLVRYMKMIKMNTNRQLRLVNNLLDIAKMNSENVRLNMAQFDIVYVTKAIISSVEIYAAQKNITLKFTSSVAAMDIYFDEEKYERIMLNLLSNSMKFTPKDKCIEIMLMPERHKKQDFIKISVRDEGIGIPSHKQQIIFDKFGQADTSMSRHAEGTGLGLHLVKMLVESLGGEISVKSKVGCGCTFTVLLPVKNRPDIVGTSRINENAHNIFDLNNRIIQATNIEFSDIYFD